MIARAQWSFLHSIKHTHTRTTRTHNQLVTQWLLSADISQWSSVYGHAPFASRQQNNNLHPASEQNTSQLKLVTASPLLFWFVLRSSRRKKIKVYLPRYGHFFKFISLFTKGSFSLGGHCDEDGPSRMEHWFPAIIGCRLLSTLPRFGLHSNHPWALTPLNRWTMLTPFDFVYFLIWFVYLFAYTFQRLKSRTLEAQSLRCTE